ncbi:MAG: NAD-dependent isocitrate dehydrogenase [Candidatus Dadabacteria bacterium]|nr:MAG: NAD-dependent isocitrate dehydrogenase [Candidatus Dadabacteria bacterium]
MAGIKAVLIPGDGIGPEISEAVKLILSEADVPVEWQVAEAGISVKERCPSGIPEETIDLIKQYRIALKGPTTTPSGTGHQSVNVAIRKSLGLYANVRPARSLPGLNTRFSNVNLVTIRENIEDTYSGTEYMQSANVAESLKLITRVGSERCIRFAFEYARRQQISKITCVHKANIHKLSDGLFLEVFNRVREEYPGIEAENMLVDNACMQLVSRPEQFRLLVMPNLYGDILSDLCAGLIGGLGVAPSGNIGNGVAVFEAVHGSAPDIAGKGIANPTALLRSALMMLVHLGLNSYATAIENALFECFKEGLTTADLGGSLSTMEFARAVADRTAKVSSGEGVADEPKNVQELFVSSGDLKFNKIASKTVKGIDVYVCSEGVPGAPQRSGNLNLYAVANRGARVLGENSLRDQVDVYCLRYLSEKPVSDEEIESLLKMFKEGRLSWVQCYKLLELDGKAAYSEIN